MEVFDYRISKDWKERDYWEKVVRGEKLYRIAKFQAQRIDYCLKRHKEKIALESLNNKE